MSGTALLFLLTAFTLLGIVLFLLLQKKARKSFATAHTNLDFLINEIKIYIKNTYPNIVIDYQKIEKIKSKNQLLAEDILIVEDIVMQFATQNIDIIPKYYISKDQLWSTYEEFSLPQKSKLPKDFLKRKELALRQYGSACGRCGQKLILSNAMTYFHKPLEEGGTYHFENIAIVCSDCYKVLTSNEDKSKIISTLHIYDYLINKINH
ncbi:MAG: HNH endonuclease [Arcobacteraceae bacterium]|jgi:hypothetical protein|nr:HNH endonuclease [Arcobacteraceae bacterium]